MGFFSTSFHVVVAHLLCDNLTNFLVSHFCFNYIFYNFLVVVVDVGVSLAI